MVLPAIQDDGTSLCEAVKPLAELERLRELDPWAFEANWNQRPPVKGSALFEAEPARFKLADVNYDGLRLIIGCDPAASEKDAADYSVAACIGVRGVGHTAEGYLLDLVRGHYAVPDFCDRVIAMQKKWKGARVIVEGVGGFKSVKQTINRIAPSLRITEITPMQDKRRRAQPLAAAWNAGRFKVPLEPRWVGVVLEEVMAFTGVGRGKKDIPDALAHAWNALVLPAPVRRSPLRLPFG